MIAAVLDTNILASGTISASTPPGQILNAWRDGQFELVTSQHILNEIERTLQKPYFQSHVTKGDVTSFMDLLKNETTITLITVDIQGVTTHPEDDLTLATAVSAKADYLVTGDGPLLRKVGSSYQDVTLVTPNDFLMVLQKELNSYKSYP